MSLHFQALVTCTQHAQQRTTTVFPTKSYNLLILMLDWYDSGNPKNLRLSLTDIRRIFPPSMTPYLSPSVATIVGANPSGLNILFNSKLSFPVTCCNLSVVLCQVLLTIDRLFWMSNERYVFQLNHQAIPEVAQDRNLRKTYEFAQWLMAYRPSILFQ